MYIMNYYFAKCIHIFQKELKLLGRVGRPFKGLLGLKGSSGEVLEIVEGFLER